MSEEVLFSIRLSLQVSALAVSILTIVSIPLAYLFARRNFRGKGVLEAVFSLPLVLPPTVLGYYLVVLFGRSGVLGGWIYELTGWTVMFTWWGAVIAAAVVAFPLIFQLTYVAMSAVDPELEQVAHTMGASRLQSFWYVTLPMAKKGILSGIALAFARAMGEFGATLMLAGNVPGRTVTMPMAIYNSFSAGKIDEANLLAFIYSTLCIMVIIYVSFGGVKAVRTTTFD